MSRKICLTIVSTLIMAAFLAIPVLAAEKPIVWRMQTVAPAGSNEYNWLAKDFVENVKILSGGRLIIELHAAGTLMKSTEVPEAVSKGVLDMAHIYLSMFGGRERGLDAASEWAKDGHPLQAVMWFYDDEGAQIMRPITERHNIYYLGVSAILGEHIWSKKPLKSVEDVKGLKMRAQALAGEIFGALGASCVTIPGEEIYPSLQRGVIDAAEYIDDIVNY
jgi:TRAP-type mannitol/chloroaromatic compound transport system substrate-binding protein